MSFRSIAGTSLPGKSLTVVLVLSCLTTFAAELHAQDAGRNSQVEIPDDVKDIPALDLKIDDNDKQRYFLIGETENPPRPQGRRLLVVMPGGSGEAGFTPFIRRIYKNVLNDEWLVAQIVAPVWNEEQARRIVWPTKALPHEDADFTTEELFDEVVKNAASRAKIDRDQIYLLAWSSSGPPAYAIAAGRKKPIAGAFIAMSVFKPNQIPEMQNPQTSCYLLQSPDDRVTPYRFAESAKEYLSEQNVRVKLQSYAGGHGWRGNVYKKMSDGIDWLVMTTGPED